MRLKLIIFFIAVTFKAIFGNLQFTVVHIISVTLFPLELIIVVPETMADVIICAQSSFLKQ